jgi:type IV pilus assembly protein PilN
MKISVNLATRPFVELRPLFARLRIAMGALAVLAVGLGIGLHFLNAQAEVAKRKMDDLQAQTQKSQMERASNERRMMLPVNQAVLERSQFLNDTFKAKSFSWTSVVMDLERVLPAGVQVTSIDPEIAEDGEVNIRLRVSTLDRDKAIELVRNLERSQRFLSPRLSNEAAQKQEPGSLTLQAQMGIAGVEFDILSGYNPLPEKKVSGDKGTGEAAVKGKAVAPPVKKAAQASPAAVARPLAPAAKAGAR